MTRVKPPLTATFFHRQNIHTMTLVLNPSTTAAFFCPQGGRCREVQLYLVHSKLFWTFKYLTYC